MYNVLNNSFIFLQKNNFMKFCIIVFILLTLTNYSNAKTGEGELKLDKLVMENVIMYLYGAGNQNLSGASNTRHDPGIIAISKNGMFSSALYCPAQYRATGGCDETGGKWIVIKNCEKYSNGSPCFIFAKKRKIIWKNGNKKIKISSKDLKSPYLVAKKIQESGFYDGDINELAGIDISTGQRNDKISITGSKSNNTRTNESSNENDLINQLETLSKLFNEGSLSEEEFNKAKKQLFDN